MFISVKFPGVSFHYRLYHLFDGKRVFRPVPLSARQTILSPVPFIVIDSKKTVPYTLDNLIQRLVFFTR